MNERNLFAMATLHGQIKIRSKHCICTLKYESSQGNTLKIFMKYYHCNDAIIQSWSLNYRGEYNSNQNGITYIFG